MVYRTRCYAVIVVMLFVLPLAACGTSGSSTQQSSTSSAVVSTASTAVKGDSPDSAYEAGLRAVYMPVLSTLDRLGANCNPVTRAKLSQCRTRLKAFQAAVTGLERYVSDTPPPADAQAEAQALVAAAKTMQQTWSQQATYLKLGDVAAANAMAGLGKPLTSNLMAFISALQILDLKLPGESLPIPSG
jgi:hypothetical protein